MLTCLAWCGPPPVAGSRRDSFRKGRAAQSGVARKTRLIWAEVGIWGGCGEALIKWGHVVGLGYFLPEVREFIKDTRPKINTTRGGRKAHRPTPKTRTIHPPSSRTVSSGRVVGGRPQTPARLGVANPPGPISVSDPIRNTDGYPCRPSPQRRRAQGCHRTALRLAPAYAG